jgi:hypothetical protein
MMVNVFQYEEAVILGILTEGRVVSWREASKD